MDLIIAQAKQPTPPPPPTSPISLPITPATLTITSASPTHTIGPLPPYPPPSGPPASTYPPYSLPLITVPQSTTTTLVFDNAGSLGHRHPSTARFESACSYIHPSQPLTSFDMPLPNSTATTLTDKGPWMTDSGFHRGPGPGQHGDRSWPSGPDYRLRKLKMPLFDGTDAFEVVYRLERFFDIQGFVTTGEKLRAAVLCMEGQALAWYRWADTRAPFRHCEGLKHQLLERFQPSHEGDIYEHFLTIKQEGPVRDYIGIFETLAAQLPGIPEKVMEGTFVKGLKPELRSSVRLLQPQGLVQTIKTAIIVEESRPITLAEPPRPLKREGTHQ